MEHARQSRRSRFNALCVDVHDTGEAATAPLGRQGEKRGGGRGHVSYDALTFVAGGVSNRSITMRLS